MKIKIHRDKMGRLWLDGRPVESVSREVLLRTGNDPAPVLYRIVFADNGEELRLDRSGDPVLVWPPDFAQSDSLIPWQML